MNNYGKIGLDVAANLYLRDMMINSFCSLSKGLAVRDDFLAGDVSTFNYAKFGPYTKFYDFDSKLMDDEYTQSSIPYAASDCLVFYIEDFLKTRLQGVCIFSANFNLHDDSRFSSLDKFVFNDNDYCILKAGSLDRESLEALIYRTQMSSFARSFFFIKGDKIDFPIGGDLSEEQMELLVGLIDAMAFRAYQGQNYLIWSENRDNKYKIEKDGFNKITDISLIRKLDFLNDEIIEKPFYVRTNWLDSKKMHIAPFGFEGQFRFEDDYLLDFCNLFKKHKISELYVVTTEGKDYYMVQSSADSLKSFCKEAPSINFLLLPEDLSFVVFLCNSEDYFLFAGSTEFIEEFAGKDRKDIWTDLKKHINNRLPEEQKFFKNLIEMYRKYE